MGKTYLFEELRVTVFAPSDLGVRAIAKVRMTLTGGSLRVSLKRAVRAFIQQHPDLKACRIVVSG